MKAYSKPKNEKIVICGVGKNIAPFIPNMIQKMEALGKAFKDYRIIIYENNSEDNTKDLLASWQHKNSKVMVISQVLGKQELYNRTRSHALSDKAPCRMELIAYARNEVLKRVMHKNFDSYNFVVMTDLDFSRGWDIAGVLSSFKIPVNWDCVTANGIGYNYHYYDRYAYRDEQEPLGPELIGDEFWDNIKRKPISFQPFSKVKKVISAFGGIAIYKRKALKDCWYSGYVTSDFEKYMFGLLNKKIDKNNWQYQLYQRTLQESATTAKNIPVIFQANCGYDGPVVCEHSTIHAAMAMKGFDKIYVNPAMVCHY